MSLFSILLISCLCYNVHLVQTRRAKHVVRELDAKQYQCLSTVSDNSDAFRNNLLRPLLIERVSGTPGNAQARQHIISKLRSTNLWDIELDTFDEGTPDGQVEFTNIVATLDPTATRRLVLACHYDSKKLPNFIGATDSAVPCAILLDLAISLQRQLNELKQNRGNPTLQLIFLMVKKPLEIGQQRIQFMEQATKMRNTNVPGQNNLNQIDAMDMFVLLDLIGDKTVQFFNNFDRTTGKYYQRLRDIETQLFFSYQNNIPKRSVFSPNVQGAHIEDDHVPFLHYNVPILHLISTPFPPTWHQASDNEANLDFQSITHIRNIMKIFVIEYLHLKQQIC